MYNTYIKNYITRMKLSFIQWIMISFMRVSTKIADDQNDAISFRHRGASSCEKKTGKTISSGHEGGSAVRFAGVRKVLVDGERQGETGLPSRESSPSKDSRTAFHAHFINSNLSPAENWIRLIPVIDASLCSRIL